NARHESCRHRFDVSLDSGNLSREKNARINSHLQCLSEHRWRADKCVAMNLTEAHELSLLEPRDQTQHSFLFAEFQMVLETDEVVAVGQQVFLAKLHNRPRLPPVAVTAWRHRFNGTVALGNRGAVRKCLAG